MATSQTNKVIQHLRRAVLLRDGAGLSDGQLLEDYLSRRDEAALAALVHRHGPMVWGVCRRVLRNYHDAEDAFQATFLVLVRKAASVMPREMVANWIYGVAHLTALRARATTAKRRMREGQVTDMPEPAADVHDLWRDLQPMLDHELGRLPDKYRVAIVLCDLEGRTRKDAARQLGVPEGTLAARVARGRVMLAKRLARHGLAVSGGLLATVLSQNVASACMPGSVVSSTIKAATLFAAGQAAAPGVISVKVAALTDGVMKTMLLTKLKIATAVLVGIALIVVLAAPAMLAFAQQEARKPNPTTAPNPKDEPQGKKEKSGWREAFVLKHEHAVNIVACSADWIAAGDEGGNLFVYDTKTGKRGPLHMKGGKEKGLTTSVDRLQFTPDGKHLFAVLSERRDMWRLNLDPKADKPSPGLTSEDPTYLGMSADGETWLESYGRNLVLRPNPWTHETVDREDVKYEAAPLQATLSENDKWLAVLTDDENLRIHDRTSLRETQTISLAKQTVNAIQFSRDGKRLAVVGLNFAKVYDPENGKEVATLKGHGGINFCVAFSPDGKTIVTGGDDHIARVWDATTGKQLAVLEGHKDSVRAVAFDASGEMLITGSADKTVKTWKLTR